MNYKYGKYRKKTSQMKYKCGNYLIEKKSNEHQMKYKYKFKDILLIISLFIYLLLYRLF